MQTQTWTPTANIRARYKAQGIELPAVVPAGPDNPMGHHAIRLAAYGGVYLLHGTNADFRHWHAGKFWLYSSAG